MCTKRQHVLSSNQIEFDKYAFIILNANIKQINKKKTKQNELLHTRKVAFQRFTSCTLLNVFENILFDFRYPTRCIKICVCNSTLMALRIRLVHNITHFNCLTLCFFEYLFLSLLLIYLPTCFFLSFLFCLHFGKVFLGCNSFRKHLWMIRFICTLY